MTARSRDEFESRLRLYLLERSEESRALRVGEKETSEQAAIVARYGDLFTSDQLDALSQAEAAEPDPDERERLYRLHKTCESGIVTARLAPLQDELQNAELAARLVYRGEELSLRAGSARMSTLAAYDEREELGPAVWDAAAELNDPRLELVRATEGLRTELSGEAEPVARSDAEKGISLRELAEVLATVGERASEAYAGDVRALARPPARPGPSAAAVLVPRRLPLPPHAARGRLHEGARDRDLPRDARATSAATWRRTRTSAPTSRTGRRRRRDRASSPSDPPTVVHLITRPMGGLQDYQDFLHEAGHALHYAGCDPALPFTFRALSRDYALTEIYSYIVQSIAREPGWHAAHFGLSPEQAAENAEAATFLDAFMFRRYLAKLLFELDFWSRFAEDRGTSGGYAERLTEATGLAYRPDRYLADMDSGFYSADYLRAWIRSAQLRSYLRNTVGEDWWRRRETGDFLRELFREGLRPSNEEMAGRIGFEPLDVGPLLAEQLGSRAP